VKHLLSSLANVEFRPSRNLGPNLFSLCALTLAALSLPVRAQIVPEDTTGRAPDSHAIFYAGPPADFSPLTAAPSELEQYGIPPRPDPADAVPFAQWKKLVTSPQTRLANLTVRATNVFHGTVKNPKVQGTVGNTTAINSSNWSGYAVTDANGTFAANHSYVYSYWTVPAVGVENCNDAPYLSAEWVGIDGFSSLDVLQAGIEVDGCPSNYYAWYEWYTFDCTVNSAGQPCLSYSVDLPINPGDLMYGDVWYTTAAPQGHAYLYNYTTQQSVSVAFNQPSTSDSGAEYQGNGVEWIVERPNGGTPNLTNYVAEGFNGALAYNGISYFDPASSPSGSTTYKITMTCPAWVPSSSCTSTTAISEVDLYGTYTMWLNTAGPASQ
jgi:hypothetical protein